MVPDAADTDVDVSAVVANEAAGPRTDDDDNGAGGWLDCDDGAVANGAACMGRNGVEAVDEGGCDDGEFCGLAAAWNDGAPAPAAAVAVVGKEAEAGPGVDGPAAVADDDMASRLSLALSARERLPV